MQVSQAKCFWTLDGLRARVVSAFNPVLGLIFLPSADCLVWRRRKDKMLWFPHRPSCRKVGRKTMTFGQGSEVRGNRVPVALVVFGRGSRKRAVFTVILTMVLLGCGGSPHSPVAAPGFVNQTKHSDADLQAIWAEAQQSVAQQIDLNPLQQLSGKVSPETLPGDRVLWE